jgi:hypothetical protein
MDAFADVRIFALSLHPAGAGELALSWEIGRGGSQGRTAIRGLYLAVAQRASAVNDPGADSCSSAFLRGVNRGIARRSVARKLLLVPRQPTSRPRLDLMHVPLPVWHEGPADVFPASPRCRTMVGIYPLHAARLGIPYFDMTEDEWEAEHARSEDV